MAVEGDPKFAEWERALRELKIRETFVMEARGFPVGHLLRQHCEKKLKEAKDAYDKIRDKL
jgi:hypothetical protein